MVSFSSKSALKKKKELVTGSSHRLPKKGHVFLRVGEELKQFEIPIEYLNHEVLKQLLTESEEQADPLDIKIAGGPLEIRPCSVERFSAILSDIEDGKPWKQEIRWLWH